MKNLSRLGCLGIVLLIFGWVGAMTNLAYVFPLWLRVAFLWSLLFGCISIMAAYAAAKVPK